ncbi:MAG TPA: site-2 protease family protein [Conexivisphaerales archaeon]|nr:site-2 protease family protein [Conexivisphaerales archaeon]
MDYYYELLIGFLAFWGVLYLIGRIPALRKHGLDVEPFYLMFRIYNVNGFFDKFLKFRRAVGVFATLGEISGVFLAAYSIWFFLNNLLSLFYAPSQFQAVTLVVPFVTIQSTQLLIYFFAAIPIILVVHEFAHAIVSRYEGISLKSGGIALFAILIAGFVEPDEKEFKAASPRKRRRVLAAGSWSNIVLAALVGALLIFQPGFAYFLPSPVRSAFYGPASGIVITGFYSDQGVQLAGAKVGDWITSVNGVSVSELGQLNSMTLPVNATVILDIRSGGGTRTVQVTTIPNPNNTSRGALGIYGNTYYPPDVNVPEMPAWVFSFLLWLSYFSAVVGAFNMLPMVPFDGEGYFTSFLDEYVPAKPAKYIRYAVNIFIFVLFAGNLLASLIRVGFRPF